MKKEKIIQNIWIVLIICLFLVGCQDDSMRVGDVMVVKRPFFTTILHPLAEDGYETIAVIPGEEIVFLGYKYYGQPDGRYYEVAIRGRITYIDIHDFKRCKKQK